ncbi:MAG: sulfatase-like hydrolase/transferase [Archaeoglobaceae archaeon]|nr:sulfatase-like hydrolase/transferase [Archaeoglobaceae archaeon]
MNYVIIVMDSVSYEQWIKAKHPNIDKIGVTKEAYSYATWTQPSLYCMAKGFFPCPLDEKYRRPIQTTLDGKYPLREALKDHTFYLFSDQPNIHFIPGFKEMFDEVRYYKEKEASKQMVNDFLNSNLKRPFFAFFFFLKTHWPYLGYRNFDETGKAMQRKAIEELDNTVKPLLELKDTYFIITSDHGELFLPVGRGHDPRPEKCGPNPKLLRVFLVEGKR